MERKLKRHALSLGLFCALTALSGVVSAQTLIQKPEKPNQNGTVEQTWSAQDIQNIGSQADPSSDAEKGMSDFNKYFSPAFLGGYTLYGKGGGGGAYDASMETYYVDEDNQLIALYDDHENPLNFSSSLNPSPLTAWEREVNPQISDQPAWVTSVVSATSARLKQKIAEARASGSAYLVWVNAASFTLRVIDVTTEEEVLRSRVIVGASGTQTPLMTTRIQNIKFNPDWSPPPSLRRKGKTYTPPSDNNPLGQARFSTDNSMNIYLHDTNNHKLFNNQIRALSAGCIRVEEWYALAQILGGLSESEVDEKTAGNKTNFYDIRDTPVWISYDRIDTNTENQVVLFGDVYHKQPLPENTLTRDVQ